MNYRYVCLQQRYGKKLCFCFIAPVDGVEYFRDVKVMFFVFLFLCFYVFRSRACGLSKALSKGTLFDT